MRNISEKPILFLSHCGFPHNTYIRSNMISSKNKILTFKYQILALKLYSSVAVIFTYVKFAGAHTNASCKKMSLVQI